MTEDERDDLIDMLPPGMNIWDPDDELEDFSGRDREWWAEALGHPKMHPGCCKTCGCGATCLFQLHHDLLIATVVRELNKLGALKKPETT